MTHTHEPSEPIAAFCFTCKHCGEEIEAYCCLECFGSGKEKVFDEEGYHRYTDCTGCHGTGIDHWEVVK